MFVYLEFLRRVSLESPIPTEAIQYNVFGSYDALYYSCDNTNSIQDMKRLFESRQLEIPWQYDRQPLFLYSNKNKDDIKGIFDINGESAYKPLILTQIHVNKEELAKHKNLDDIILSVSDYVRSIQKEIGAGSLRFSVMMSLGVSDLLIVFRDDIIGNTAKILYRMRMNDHIAEHIDILSLCSYIAFPINPVIESRRENVKKWINKEKENATNISINTLYDTSIGKKGIGVDPDVFFQLGEWDFGDTIDSKDYDGISERIISLIEDNLSENIKDYSSCYTSVRTRLETIQPVKDQQGRPTQISSKYEVIKKKILMELRRISQNVEKHPEIVENCDNEVIQIITTFSSSLMGLLNYVNRLSSGHYQDDVCQYINSIYSLLPLVLKTYREAIETEIKNDNTEQACALINDMVIYNAELITAFQHLFAVISVSPHTFIETFGCNMRSLAASSRLLCAYQSILSALNKVFPDMLLENGHFKKAVHAMLILPYRKVQSTHKLLYTMVSPLYRISVISLDYSTMFNMKSTIFMLLHECGHHIGERLRYKRFWYIPQAVFSALLYRYYGEFITAPIDAIINFSYPEGKDGKVKGKNLLSIGLSAEAFKRIKVKYEEKIRKETYTFIEGFVASLTFDFTKWYEKCRKEFDLQKINYLSFNNYFVSDLLDVLGEFIEVHLCFRSSKQEMQSWCDEARKDAHKNLGAFYKSLYNVVSEMATDILREKGNMRVVARLHSDYHLLTQTNDVLDGFAQSMLTGLYANNELNMIVSVFRDVFSDLFAIATLKCSLQDYIQTIPELFSLQLNQILTDKALLLRLMVVVNVAFGIYEIDKVAAFWDVSDTTLVTLTRNWSELSKFPAKGSIIEYAKECFQQLKKDDDLVSSNEAILSLREFYLGKKTEIELVFILWKQLMEGEL